MLIETIRSICRHLPAPSARAMLKNLCANWYFPLSALAFFWAQVQWLVEPEIWHVSLTVAALSMIIVAGQAPPLWQVVRRHGWLFQCWALLSACGITLRGQRYAFDALSWSAAFRAWAGDNVGTLARYVSVALALIGFLFVYLCVAWFFEKLLVLLSESGCFRQLHRWEWGLYGTLTLALLYCMARVFLVTQAFYIYEGGGYDVIYTSDSGTLVYNMGYLFLTFPENDLRQPLFAVFAAPFIGAPYLLGEALGLSDAWSAILVNGMQVLLLVVANLLLARLLVLSPLERAGFMLVTSVCYAQALAVLMMEQYIVAYFWLMLALVLLCRSRDIAKKNAATYHPPLLALYGAGSTLLTSFFWLPLASGHSPRRNFMRWLGDMCALGLGYILLLLAFGRFDVLATILDKIESLGKFAGEKVPIIDRIYQYSGFVHDIFLAPAASVGTNTTTPTAHVSWMLDAVSQLNLVGVVIFMLAFLSAWLGRRERLPRMALCWILLSLVLLIGLGWGTQENGLILYALYFGWAYLILLAQLLLRLTRKLRAAWLFAVFCVLIAILLAGVNVQGLLAMVRYGIEYFPN